MPEKIKGKLHCMFIFLFCEICDFENAFTFGR